MTNERIKEIKQIRAHGPGATKEELLLAIDDLLAASQPGEPGKARCPNERSNKMKYDIEAISAKVHQQWMESKRAKGVTSRKLESGEELMVAYAELSEEAKELDRGSVKAVIAAIEAM